MVTLCCGYEYTTGRRKNKNTQLCLMDGNTEPSQPASQAHGDRHGAASGVLLEETPESTPARERLGSGGPARLRGQSRWTGGESRTPSTGHCCSICPPSTALGGPGCRGGDSLGLVLPGRPRAYRGMTGLEAGHTLRSSAGEEGVRKVGGRGTDDQPGCGLLRCDC